MPTLIKTRPVKKVICRFSCGAASAIATKLAIEKYGKVEIFYNDTGSEHPDNVRFIADCERWYGQKINVLRSVKYKNTFEVFEKLRFLSSPRGAPCTAELKRIPGEAIWNVGDIEVFGYTAGEESRVDRFRAHNDERIIECPLIEKGYTKDDCFGLLKQAGIELPVMYQLGFRNNNCIGCVKARDNLNYWKRVRKFFPVEFNRIAGLERELKTTVNRVTKGGKRTPIYLDEIPPGDPAGGDPKISCGLFCAVEEPEEKEPEVSIPMHEFYEEEVKETLGKLNRLLADLPAPGGGFNPALLPVAHAAFMAGCSSEEFGRLVRANIRAGSRAVNDAEIRRAFERVASNPGAGSGEAKVKIVVDAMQRQKVIDAGREAGPWWVGFEEMDPQEQMITQLKALFLPNDPVWIGSAEKDRPVWGEIHRRDRMIEMIEVNGPPPKCFHLIVNPLGKEGTTKDGRPSTTADANVARCDHVLIEFDGLPLEDQAAFWAGIHEPRLRTLTFSGGKSIHALLFVGDMPWEEAVSTFRDRRYGPLGVDVKVFTPSRRARLAGGVRNGIQQTLLWSAPCRLS